MWYLEVLGRAYKFFFFNDTATTEIYTLSLHDALPISKVHNARSKGIMAHLVLAGGYLLHHEEGQTYETEAVAEVFEHDTAAYEHEARGLVKGQEGVGHEGKVEHQGERKEAFLESPVCYVVAGEDTSDDESGRSERAVEQSYLLFAKPQALVGPRRFEEKGHYLHHEALGKAVEHDEENVINDVFLAEEVGKYFPKFLERVAQSFALIYLFVGRGQDKEVIAAQRHHEDRKSVV